MRKLQILLALIAIAGCAPVSDIFGHDDDGVDRPTPNTVTPGGTLVRETEAIQSNPTLEAEIFAEIDSAAIPASYVVVLHDVLDLPSPFPGTTYRGYTEWGSRESIHLGTSVEPVPIRYLAGTAHAPAVWHESEHARCQCYCTPDGLHNFESRCK